MDSRGEAKMAKIQWSLAKAPNVLKISLKQKWWRLQIVFKSLFYNDFLNWSYACDILMEPMFWFVENFTACLGPLTGICGDGKPANCQYRIYCILLGSTLVVGSKSFGDDNSAIGWKLAAG